MNSDVRYGIFNVERLLRGEMNMSTEKVCSSFLPKVFLIKNVVCADLFRCPKSDPILARFLARLLNKSFWIIISYIPSFISFEAQEIKIIRKTKTSFT